MADSPSLFSRNLRKNFPVAVRGEGSWIISADGRRFLDASGQAAVVSIGHGVAEIGRAMAEQSAQIAFAHTSQFHTEPAEKLAQRLRAFRTRPALGTFVVMFAILNVAYLAYGAGFAVIRLTGSATSVACPYPYPEAKVYDPEGLYEKAGQPGPYFPGIGSGGRPNVSPPPNGGRCSPKT